MANEVSRAGIMKKLMDLIDCEDDTLSYQAFTVLLPLAAHPHSAALIGASDGVHFFFSHLDSPRRHIVGIDMISGLCQLSKEAVNRVKMREVGALKVLLKTLKDDEMVEVQDRVISCLVNFLYDDASLTIMLDDGLVDILLSHLQRCGGYTSDLSLDVHKIAERLYEPDENSVLEIPYPAADQSAENSVSHPVDDSYSKECSTEGVLETEIDPLLKHDGSGKASFPKNEDYFNDEQDMFETEEEESAAREGQRIAAEKGNAEANQNEVGDEEGWSKMEESPEPVPRHTYSINSPTYQAESEWRMEDYHPGVTRKSYNTNLSPTSGTNYSEDSGSPTHNPYSPLSTLSYHSPSQSDHLSPTHSSPASSPAYSYATLSPDSSFCDSPPGSPQPGIDTAFFSPLSPLRGASSPEWERSTSPSPTTLQGFAGLEFSSSEDEEEQEDFVSEQQPQQTGSITDQGNESVSDNTHPASKVRFTLFKEEVPPKVEAESMDCDPCEARKRSHQNESVKEASLLFPDLSSSVSGAGKRKLFEEASQQFGASVSPSVLDQRFFRMTEPSQEKEREDASSTKRPKVHAQKRSEGHSSTTQINILIVLSRLSVCDDLSKYLATSRGVCCLTDHLAFAREPQDRCVRTLSRILCSPHCLTALLTMCAPAILVKTLMLDSGSVLVSDSTTRCEVDGSFGRSGSHLSRQEESIELDMRSLMRMSAGSNRSKSIEIRQPLLRMQSEPILRKSSSQNTSSVGTDRTLTNPRKQRGSRILKARSEKTDPCEPGSSGSRSGWASKKLHENLVKVGAQLLADLSNQAMSPYGEGVILYTFHCLSAPKQLMFAASLLFLQSSWPRERRQKFLFQEGALDRVLTALQAHNDSSTIIKDVLVLGLVFFAHGLIISPRFQPADVPRLFQKAVEALSSGDGLEDTAKTQESQAGMGRSSQGKERSSCKYTAAEKDLQLVVGRGRLSKVIWASREQLSTNSTMFAAMLQGSYVESTQSQVSISDVSPQALTFILHFLHGCDEQCAVLKSAERRERDAATDETGQGSSLKHPRQSGLGSSSQQHLKDVLNLIALADRFLLPDLVQYLSAVVSTSLLDNTCVEEVLRFAVFHCLSELAEDAAKSLLMSPRSIADIASCLVSLAEGPFGSDIAAVLLSLLRRGVMTNQ
ncbi:hypothetical protein V1264_021901 [Littorina saxatilis]|uniref:BTB domain-containing protein n=3 Tax=Littorina saxatilis TaxID=31220 RepID=A0AAN9AJ42_9CAEN